MERLPWYVRFYSTCRPTDQWAALEVLHKLGWVHRDISAGNIMLCGNNAKITDFEYAKKMTLPGKVHEIRTVRPSILTLMLSHIIDRTGNRRFYGG